MELTLSVILFCVGFYAVVAKKNLIKIIIGSAVMGYAVNLFIILIGFRLNSTLPVFVEGGPSTQAVDPMAQAMVLAASLIGLSVTLLLTALSLKLYEQYGTFDINEIKLLKG